MACAHIQIHRHIDAFHIHTFSRNFLVSSCFWQTWDDKLRKLGLAQNIFFCLVWFCGMVSYVWGHCVQSFNNIKSKPSYNGTARLIPSTTCEPCHWLAQESFVVEKNRCNKENGGGKPCFLVFWSWPWSNPTPFLASSYQGSPNIPSSSQWSFPVLLPLRKGQSCLMIEITPGTLARICLDFPKPANKWEPQDFSACTTQPPYKYLHPHCLEFLFLVKLGPNDPWINNKC